MPHEHSESEAQQRWREAEERYIAKLRELRLELPFSLPADDPRWEDVQAARRELDGELDAIRGTLQEAEARMRLAGWRRLDPGPIVEKLLPEPEERGERPPAEAEAVWLGGQKFSVAGSEFTVTPNEANVLQGAIELRTFDGETLDGRSGVKDAARVLRRVRDKYEFGPFIHCPGKRGAGGYRVNIVDGRDT